MKTFFKNTLLLGVIFLTTFCQPSKNNQNAENAEDSASNEEGGAGEESPKYTLTEVTSPEFANASLSLNNVQDGQNLPVGKFNFDFTVNNYELSKQTEDAEGKGLASSADGQHIHFILDNGPYSAHYTPKFEMEMEEGGHVLLAFLSRSYHESIKNKNAFIVRTFTVGKADKPEFDPKGAHLFYSRPKGEYTLAVGDKLLLDFYLINTDLAPDGNKVRATVNGEEHLISKWAPYAIDGLEPGDITVKLELMDKDGRLIPGPFNKVERTVTLKAAQ